MQNKNSQTNTGHEVHLFAGERIERIEELSIHKLKHYPTATKALQRLADVTKHQDIGENGPLIASLATEQNSHIHTLHEYEVLFGRDALVSAMFLVDQHPLLLQTTIIRMAELQGVTYNIHREEEPGRIVHEYRDPKTDQRAQLLTKKRGWQWPYYASVDATIYFVRAIYLYCSQIDTGTELLKTHYKGLDGKTHTILQSLFLSINWIIKRMDGNEEGFVEFKPAFPGSLTNQAWKDSCDSYHHADKSIPDHTFGIASIEVQTGVYDALLEVVSLIEQKVTHTITDQTDRIKLEHLRQDLLKRAEKIKKQIIKYFWIAEKGGYFALGTERTRSGKLKPMKIRTSNMGHVLNSRLLDDMTPESLKMREALVTCLMSAHMLTPSGIRTLAKGEGRYRPGSYQNGSVWLWDTYFISQGLRRHGYHKEADVLDSGLLRIIDTVRKFPEFVRGDSDKVSTLNTRIIDVIDTKNDIENRIEQPPQEIQAWSVAAIAAIEYRMTKELLQGEKYK